MLKLDAEKLSDGDVHARRTSSMKIVYISAGAGGMYCGSCLHDNTLAAALLQTGQDLILVPIYTPLRTDEANVSQRRLFYGGINVYLQQKSALFRHTPWFLDRLLDVPSLIAWLSRRSSMTHAEQLGALTVSMLRGEHGNQRKELEKLVRWLQDEVRPDVVHVSNTMLLGLASAIRKRLGVPLVSTLSGEDIFLEKLPQPYYGEARRLLNEKARDVDAFVAMNRYFADFTSDYLSVPRAKIHVIPHGLNLQGHGSRRHDKHPRDFTIGYLSRICPEKGLHQLVEAAGILADDPSVPAIQVRAAGYLDPANGAYLDEILASAHDQGLADRFQYVGELTRSEKIDFIQSLDVMSMPTVYHESKGIPVLEAMANAVPVVLPAHGAFPELIEDTGGGILCEPDDTSALADALKTLIDDPARAEALGAQGQKAIHSRYNADIMARRTIELYRQVTSAGASSSAKDKIRRRASPEP